MTLVAGVVIWVVWLGTGAWAGWPGTAPPHGVDTTPAPEFVGVQACVGCHADQYRAWRGSHHALAMMAASEKSVLGIFEG